MSPEIANATSSPRISPDFMFYHSVGKNSNPNSDSLNGRAKRRNIVDLTRKHYNEDFEAFILNNIAMVFVPFENYEEDLKIFRSKDSSRLQELRHLNQQFEKKYNKTVIYPDTFFEHVNKHIVFQRRCDPSATSLIRERIYIVDKLVEVNEENTEEFDQNINDTNEQSVKVKLLQSENNLGYVKLQSRIHRKSTVSSTSSWNSYPGNLTTSPRSYQSSNSTASSSESNRAPTEDPLGPLDTFLLNDKKSWFKRVRNENFNRTTMSIIENDMEQQVHRHHEYMSPTKYVADFAKEFKETIELNLGLDPQRLVFSKTRSTIYCQSGSVNYEISPALDINWPNQLTTNWLQRRRNEMVDPNSKNSLPLQWPSDIALQEAQLGKCIIIPRYTTHKYETTMTDEFEWEIAFPRAEKYLQTTMTHAQTKTFLLLALIHRSFIEPLTKHKGVLLDHFKTFFYWEMEKTYVSFPETRMGSKVIDILKTIYAKLGERKLKHYFYGPDKNVFDNVSDNLIATAQDQLNNILNNKVTYFIAALCNLRYKSNDDGFPQFDFKKLHQLLIEEHLISKPSTNLNDLKFASSPLIIHKTEKSQEWIDLKVPCKASSNETVRKVHSLKLFIEHFLEVGRVCFVRSRMQLGRTYYLQARDLTTILAEQGLHERDVNTYTEFIRRACPDL